MAVPPILLLLVAMVTRCNCDHANSYSANSGTTASQFGAILKPPPPPQLSPIVPVPFHGGADKHQLQNLETLDGGYHYPPPAPPSPPPIKLSKDFKFPAPFYKQYNFNFVPPPQPFSTTPSPSLFQKVSGWLFPSQQTSYAGSTVFNNNNIAPIKKDCNPCNLVPWLPVIRYNIGNKNVYHQSSLPTYGPPSPTAYADLLKVAQQHPEPFQPQNDERRLPQLSPGPPHKTYGPPSYNTGNIRIVSSTYGPPSATHTLDVSSHNPPRSTYSQPSSSYAVSSSSYSLPNNQLSTIHNQPSLSLNQLNFQPYQPSSSLQSGASLNQYSSHLSTPGQEVRSIISNIASSTYSPLSSSYGTPSPFYGTPYPVTTTFQPVTPIFDPDVLNKELPQDSDVDILRNVDPIRELQLPKVSHPISFKNSYGEPITNPDVFEIPHSASPTAAESSKVKIEISPHGYTKQPTANVSFALSNPAPFTVNRGRNIHTLQPVALPNLSVSPLPPIFNARPFRPIVSQFSTNFLHGINQIQRPGNTVNVEQSIPLAEFTHSVDYPATIIQSPVIEIDATRNFNQSKAYRNIPNSYITDDIRDISSQASEDHISATKSIPDSSFESTGTEVDNDLYGTGAPSDLKPISQVPPNHQPGFADLRGVKDEDVDKYRTESNLQNIDSPLLYLKPSAPHKNYGNFVLAVSSPIPDNEYEIYDDAPTTISPQANTPVISWDESRSGYNGELSPPPVQQQNVYQPKIVQIIVPYTTGNNPENVNVNDFVQMQVDTISTPNEEYQPRKVPSNTDNSYVTTVTENYSTRTTTTEETLPTVTENYDSDRLSSSGNKDLYDVKEPTFDIIKLQHNIDDWTEQEYSKQYKTPQRTRSSEKYAKQIPDEYFTTTVPTNFVTATNNYNYEFYDHEGSSSIQHSVTDEVNDTSTRPRKEYNVIDRTKSRHNSGKNEESEEVQRLHIYTAASSFRKTTTTTPAPWGKIQTSISPLTKEKVYVVTSKPWRENRNGSSDWYDVDAFESQKTNTDYGHSGTRDLPFKSPRFITRPSFGFTSGGKVESAKSDSSYGFSRSWYQSINELQSQGENNTSFLGDTHQNDNTNLDEV